MRRRNRLRQILAIAIVAVSLALTLIIILRLHGETSSDNDVATLPKNVDLSLKEPHLSEVKDGVKKWDLVAKQADYDRTKDVTHLKTVKIVLFGDQESGDITLNADRADFNNKSKDVELIGNIVAVTTKGMRFTTDRAHYDAATSMVTSRSRVKLIKDRLSVEGVGMELALKDKNARVLHQVEAIVMPEEK